MRIVAIDPGTTKSGVVVIVDDIVCSAVHADNDELYIHIHGADKVLIEWVVYYGNNAGETLFRTAFVCGVVSQICRNLGIEYHEMSRPDVCRELVGRTKGASKAVVNQAVRDKYPQTGGGATPVIGTKKEPGELYIFRETKGAKHAWDALALYHAWIAQPQNW